MLERAPLFRRHGEASGTVVRAQRETCVTSTAMRRIGVSALVLSALSTSAWAQVIYVPYGGQPVYANQPLYANQAAYANQPVYAAQPTAAAAGQNYYYVYAQPRYANPAPPSYAGAVAPGYAPVTATGYAPVTATPRYATAGAPVYTGSVTPHAATVAAANVVAPQPQPPTMTAPPAPAYVAAAAPSPGGGGFLEAIFGGPTIQVPAPRGYQPAPQPEPQVTVINPPTSYTATGTANAAAYSVDPKFSRQVVEYRGEEKPGTVVIDTPNKFLYLVEDDGKALRYGIGVGRPGFTWAGVKEITAKREWPDWRPPSDMLARRPDLPRFMPGGIDNPLGARAMYLGSTLYRIHGSNEPWTIGTNVSSGCIRMRNDDVTDLYDRVKIGTKVVVM